MGTEKLLSSFAVAAVAVAPRRGNRISRSTQPRRTGIPRLTVLPAAFSMRGVIDEVEDGPARILEGNHTAPRSKGSGLDEEVLYGRLLTRTGQRRWSSGKAGVGWAICL